MKGESGAKGILTVIEGEAYEPDAKPDYGKKSRKAGEDRLLLLKRACDMAAEAVCELLQDEKQFCRHAYQDKSSGAIMEATLNIRNVKQIRETIQVIRELTDAIRSLYGIMSPEAQREMNIQLKKLKMEKMKISQNAGNGGGADTGVVILPMPEDGADG